MMNATDHPSPPPQSLDTETTMPKQFISVELEQDEDQILGSNAISNDSSDQDEYVDTSTEGIPPKRPRLSVDIDNNILTLESPCEVDARAVVSHQPIPKHQFSTRGSGMNHASMILRSDEQSEVSEPHSQEKSRTAQLSRNGNSTQVVVYDSSTSNMSDSDNEDSSDDCRLVGFSQKQPVLRRKRGMNISGPNMSTETLQCSANADMSSASGDSRLSTSTFEYLRSSIEARVKTLNDDHAAQLMGAMKDLLNMTHTTYKAQLNKETQRLKTKISKLSRDKQRLKTENNRLAVNNQQMLDGCKTNDRCGFCLAVARERAPVFCDVECEENYQKKRRCQ